MDFRGTRPSSREKTSGSLSSIASGCSRNWTRPERWNPRSPRGSSVSPGGCKRAERLQAAAFDSLYAKQKDSLSEKLDSKPGRRRRFDPRPGHRAGFRQQQGAGSAADVRAKDRAQPLPDHGGTQEAQTAPGGGAGGNVGVETCVGERRRRRGESRAGRPCYGACRGHCGDNRRSPGRRLFTSHCATIKLHTSPIHPAIQSQLRRRSMTAKLSAIKRLRWIRPAMGRPKQSQSRAGSCPVCRCGVSCGGSSLQTSNIKLHTSPIPLQTSDGFRGEEDTLKLRIGRRTRACGVEGRSTLRGVRRSGDGFGLDTRGTRCYNSGPTGASRLSLCTVAVLDFAKGADDE